MTLRLRHLNLPERRVLSMQGYAEHQVWEGLPMTRETATRVQIALLVYLMTNGVIFGAGVILVLTWPALSADTGFWISVVVAASFILAAPIAWWIAPRMRARYWRGRMAADHAP
ncbi:MAG: hypothetical protein ACXW6T_24425 [Candidatus Binatia bacterium]